MKIAEAPVVQKHLLGEKSWICVLVGCTSVFAWIIEPFVGYTSVGIIFLVGVCLGGLVLSRVSVFLLATIYSLIHDFFFIPPIFSFAISRVEDVLLLLTFFIAAAIIGSLTSRLRFKEQLLQATIFERESYYEQSKTVKVMEETQKLYKTLMDSVSHELKTPLAAIKGSASALLDPAIKENAQVRETLAAEILTGASRLQRLVENLLDMTRVESGMLRPKVTAYAPSELIDACLRKGGFYKSGHSIHIRISPTVSDVLCDPTLFEQALNNIVHNALSYAPGPIDISVSQSLDKVRIGVRDHGKGLPFPDPEKVFDKFYRVDPQFTGGVGLGLSISKSFIELQKGEIHALNHPEGGAQFNILLPAMELQ